VCRTMPIISAGLFIGACEFLSAGARARAFPCSGCSTPPGCYSACINLPARPSAFPARAEFQSSNRTIAGLTLPNVFHVAPVRRYELGYQLSLYPRLHFARHHRERTTLRCARSRRIASNSCPIIYL